jgi:adenosylcobinamide-GDP ribazoletransferase
MGFFQALSFLTVLRVTISRVYDDKDAAEWGRYFFLVGIVVGAMTAGIDHVLMKRFSALSSSAVCILFIAIITGGLHLDGVSDTFDAAFSMKSVAGKLDIMKKSDIGVFGVAAIVFVIIMKIALLAEISGAERIKVILVFPAVSRVCMLVPAYLYDYPRKSGKGAGFVKNMTSSILVSGFLTAIIILYVIMQVKGIMLLILAIFFCALLSSFFNKRFNGITGDVLGCINELTEIFVLFCAVLI